jgi:hypothetical protein
MSTEGCYINNVYVTWEESRLFDMYRLYINNKIDRKSFIDNFNYDNFDRAEVLYNKIMGKL